ncbi:hypothetical protein WA026_010274 [Henosepilachna vigintioctopunctata]|uniref:Uncharacterized protein n=1 Tax=Henosepilachna vigintioctopunctata TaxID=420089 RepID=A0AAW1UH27_9CUCU
MSGGDSSGDSSDGENGEGDNPLQIFIPPEISLKTSKSSPENCHPPAKTSRLSNDLNPTTTFSTTNTSTNNKTTPSTSTNSNPPPLISPLVYQTPQGMMYAQSNGGGVLFSLAQTDPNSSQPQFITIPLSMVSTNGQGELDLSKRKLPNSSLKDEELDSIS